MAHHREEKIGRTHLEGRGNLAVETRMLFAQEFDFEAIITCCDGLLEHAYEHEATVFAP